MSYSAIDQLTNDVLFAGRVRACATEQAETYINDARAGFVAVANDVLRGGATYLTFVRIVAAAPGIADTAAAAGAVDQSRILDADILAAVQTNWQTVAGLHYDDEGNPPVTPKRKDQPYDQFAGTDPAEPKAPEPDGDEDLDADGNPLAAEASTESPADAL